MEPRWPDAQATSQERHLAAATHVASLFFPIIGPVVAFALQRKQSKFVAVNALQALFEALILNAVLFVALAISLIFTLIKVWELVQTGGESFSWDLVWTALLKAAVTWIILGAISLYYMISTLFQAWRALQGEWKPSMLSGRWAGRAILGRRGKALAPPTID